MPKPQFQIGKYQVTRWCCTSGMCMTCKAVGDRDKRHRVVHTHGVSKEWAEFVAGNWDINGFEAKAELQ